MFKLRPYQQKVFNDIALAWSRVLNVLAVLPTGGGKTVIFSSVIREHKGAAAAIVHRKEIVAQISLSLARMGVKHRVVAQPQTVALIRKKHYAALDASFIDQASSVGVASVQTLTSASAEKNHVIQSWVKQVTLAVYDEGHHYIDSGKWAKAVHMFDQARKLFVTATPERADGRGLGDFAQEMIEGPTTKWLIDNKFLSPYKYFAPNSDLDVTGLAVTGSGDFNAKALRARVVDSHLVGDVVAHYKRFGESKQFIVFSTDVATANEQAEAFKAAGITCEALSGQTEQGERDRALAAFERGETCGLVNVDLFDEGFDVPAVVVAILARPTESLAKYLQMVGRALRIMDGKPHAIIIDPVRNWERHGLPDWPRVWSLEGKEKGSRSTGGIASRICSSCTQLYEAYYSKCPYCGHAEEPKSRRTPQQVDGDLTALDVDGLAALFQERQAANLSRDDFEARLIARNVPRIARPRLIRKHEAVKYRRDVLHHLIGWWVGIQEREYNRDMQEIYKRFFLRFGVDMSTAFTLDEKQTDNLINKIKEGFHYDILTV